MALKLKGSTSGFVAIDAPSVAGNNTLILPENTGSAQQLLGNDITAGVVTFTSVTVNRNGDLTVPGTISIGGTLTYEDVTSVDSVGIVTARSGVRVNGGGLTIIGDTTGLKASGISTFGGIVQIGGATENSADIDTSNTKLIIKQSGGAQEDGIYMERSGERRGHYIYVGGALDQNDALCVTTNQLGGDTDLLAIDRAGDVIIGAGNLGIHSTSPDRRFTLYQNATTRMNLKSLADSTVGIEFGDPADHNIGFIVYDNTNDSMQFGVNAGERVRIDSNGRLLIGTTTEGHSNADDLTIANTANTGITIRSGTSNDGNIFFSDATSGDGETKGTIKYNHTDDKFTLNVNGSTRLSVNSSGNSQFTGIVTATEFVATSVQTSGRKNLIINGGMSIAQRGVAAVTATTTATYKCVDRWKTDIDGSGGGSFSHAQSTDVPTGQGLRHSSVFTTVTQASQPTSESNRHQLYQMLEKQDVYHLEWGTSNAKTCTLSFWVKGSITGTYGLMMTFYGGTSYYYYTNYTINSANTWEKKTITITGPTSGNNVTADSASAGFRLEFILGVGSDAETGTLNEWVTSNTLRTASGTVYLPENSGATLYLTGVQFEVGSNASAFEFRSFGEELTLCQRYFFNVKGNNQNRTNIPAFANSSTTVRAMVSFPTPMRATPTFSGSATNMVFDSSDDSDLFLCSALTQGGSMTNNSPHGMLIEANPGGMTAGQSGVLEFRADNGVLNFSAEL